MSRHPSKDVIGSLGEELKGKRIVLCVTGSLSAYRCPDVARSLMKHGAEVFAVMSDMAQKIIHPYLMECVTGNPVVTELTGGIEHVDLGGGGLEKTDLVIIAPATANIIGKIACGVGDTAVTSTAIVAVGAGTPILVVPAMHGSMYQNPVVAENIRKLKALGLEFVGPKVEEGRAKFAEVEEVVEAAVRRLTGNDMSGLNVLVSAGSTIEYIDPIRVLTNRSSGKMGVAMAREAWRRGANVTLVCGFGTAKPEGLRVMEAETTQQMQEAVLVELRSTNYHVFVAAAAAADYSPEKKYSYKIPTDRTPELTLKLKPTKKIVQEAKKLSPKTFVVAFRAEHGVSDEKLIKSAYDHLKLLEADLIVANDVGRQGCGFRVDTNEVFIIDKSGEAVHVPQTSKQVVAAKVFDRVLKLLSKRD